MFCKLNVIIFCCLTNTDTDTIFNIGIKKYKAKLKSPRKVVRQKIVQPTIKKELQIFLIIFVFFSSMARRLFIPYLCAELACNKIK